MRPAAISIISGSFGAAPPATTSVISSASLPLPASTTTSLSARTCPRSLASRRFLRSPARRATGIRRKRRGEREHRVCLVSPAAALDQDEVRVMRLKWSSVLALRLASVSPEATRRRHDPDVRRRCAVTEPFAEDPEDSGIRSPGQNGQLLFDRCPSKTVAEQRAKSSFELGRRSLGPPVQNEHTRGARARAPSGSPYRRPKETPHHRLAHADPEHQCVSHEATSRSKRKHFREATSSRTCAAADSSG